MRPTARSTPRRRSGPKPGAPPQNEAPKPKGEKPPAARVQPLPDGHQPDVVSYRSGFTFAVVKPTTPAMAERYVTTPRFPVAPLIEAPEDAPLSAHLCVGDFTTSDESYRCVRVHPRIVDIVEDVWTLMGKHADVVVLAGHEPLGYLRLHGRDLESPHMNGVAVKITCPRRPLGQLFQAALEATGDSGQVQMFPRSHYVSIVLHHTRRGKA